MSIFVVFKELYYLKATGCELGQYLKMTGLETSAQVPILKWYFQVCFFLFFMQCTPLVPKNSKMQ